MRGKTALYGYLYGLGKGATGGTTGSGGVSPSGGSAGQAGTAGQGGGTSPETCNCRLESSSKENRGGASFALLALACAALLRRRGF
jgi:hypothetical protein